MREPAIRFAIRRGIVILIRVLNLEAPKSREASSSDWLVCCNPALAALTIKGKRLML